MSNLKRFENKTTKRKKQKRFYSRSLAMFTALMLAAGSLPGAVFASQALEPSVSSTIMESFPEDQEVPEEFDDVPGTLGLPAEWSAESEISEELTGAAEEYNVLTGEVPSGSSEENNVLTGEVPSGSSEENNVLAGEVPSGSSEGMSDEQSTMDPDADLQMENDPEGRNDNEQEFPEEGSALNEEIPAEGTWPEDEIPAEGAWQEEETPADEAAQDQMERPDETEDLENSTETAEDAQESDTDDSMDLPEDQWETDDSNENGNTEGGYESPENPQGEYPFTEEPYSEKEEDEAPSMTSENPSDTASEESALPETAVNDNDASGESFVNDASSDATADENEEETVSETAKNSSLKASGRVSSSIKWELTEDYDLIISGTGAMPDYRELEDYSTTAPWYKYGAFHITIEEGITRVGAYAFSRCYAASLSLPKSLRTIGEEAFSVNYFEQVHIPRGVTTIGESAFYSCTLLTSVDIPETVTKIEDYAFGACTELKNIYLPDSVTALGEGAFCCCQSLEWACLSDGIETVKMATFMGCDKLIDVSISGYSNLKTIEQQAFDECPSLGKISIPNSVTKIGSYNFEGKNTVIVCKYDSYAMNYAIRNKIKFEVFGSGMKVNKATVTGLSAKTYTGSQIRPVPTVKLGITKLVKGEDFTLSYKNNVKAGTATVIITGNGSYGGTLTKTFKINPKSIAGAGVTNVKNRTWTGKALGQQPTVKLGGRTLKKGTDYKISYRNNVNIGTATMTITGMGNYGGKLTRNFKINRRTIKNATISGIKTRVWTGNALGQNPVIKVGGVTLKKGTDYRFSYKNNKNVGSAVLTITGKGNYTGSITKKFTIIPRGTTFTSLRGGKGSLTLKWKKQNVQISAYQIQYSSRKDFKTQKTVSVGTSAVSKTIKGLYRNHLYYVRIRTYKTVGNKRLYSRWNSTRSCRTSNAPVSAPVSVKSRAIAAYKALLSKSTVNVLPKGKTIYDWETDWDYTYSGSKAGNVKFALAYIDNNTVPELILYENKVGYGVWTYKNGSVSCIYWGDYSDKPYGYYKKKGIFVYNAYSEGTPFTRVYSRYSGSAFKNLLGIFYPCIDGESPSYLDYTGSSWEGDGISSSTFSSRLKRYTGSTSMTKISLNANTKANRDRVIK